jgi:tetratricopeptide (TPR) repeat protein
MRRVVFSLACVVFAAFSAAVLADDREDCSSNDVDRIIRGCTEVINSRQELRQTLAIAHHRRGIAYASKKEYDRAIADFTEAIGIDPKHVSAYNDRGLAHTSKGDYARAIADVTRAVELTSAKPASRTLSANAATPPPTKSTKGSPSAATKTSAIANVAAGPPAKSLAPTPTHSELDVIPSWATSILKNGLDGP